MYSDKIDELHSIVFSRFIRTPYGHMLDYAAKRTEDTPIPTAEECNKGMPNALSWWVPIENGAFFTSLYFYSLICGDNPDKDELDLLLNGMFIFADVGNVKGFIARGVGDDGISHYPLGSDDQTGPWMLAMYKAYRSVYFSAEQKQGIAKRIKAVGESLYEHSFDIVADIPGVFRGSFRHADWRGCCYNLFVHYVMADLFGGKWRERYENATAERFSGTPYTRLEIVSHGFAPDMVSSNGLIQFWIHIGNHLCVKELAELDKDNRDMYIRALENDAATAVRFINKYKQYVPDMPFDENFRVLNKFYEPFDGDSAHEAQKAMEQNAYWMDKIVPARRYEHDVLGQAIFAMWICLSSPDKAAFEAAKNALIACVDTIDWHKLNLCYSFVVEAALRLI